jgi:flagellar FliJ protein
MRQFVFKLEGVLEQRQQVENRCQRSLAEAHRQVIWIEQQIDDAARAEKSATTPLRGRLDPRTLATQVRFSQVMRQKLSALREQLDAARHDLTTAQAALTEAAKQRKVLEKLQERQQARFVQEQQKKELNEQDDLAQQMTRENSDPNQSFPPLAP